MKVITERDICHGNYNPIYEEVDITESLDGKFTCTDVELVTFTLENGYIRSQEYYVTDPSGDYTYNLKINNLQDGYYKILVYNYDGQALFMGSNISTENSYDYIFTLSEDNIQASYMGFIKNGDIFFDIKTPNIIADIKIKVYKYKYTNGVLSGEYKQKLDIRMQALENKIKALENNSSN